MVALVLLMVLQATAPVAVAAASTPGQGNGPPDGMVGVPNAAVSDKIPDHAQGKVPDASAFRGSVMTDAHADTLAVEVTTRAAAQGRANACRGNGKGSPPFCDDPTLALQVSDDVNHDGRRVAVPGDVLADALGYVPTTATVVHESGREYDVAVRERGSLYVFDLDGFSTNTVTFESSVELGGGPAKNGTTFSYGLSDMNATSDVTGNLTGVLASEWDNESSAGVGLSSSSSVSFGGTHDPIYSDGGDPILEVTANALTTSYNPVSVQGDGDTSRSPRLLGDRESWNGENHPYRTELQIQPDYSGEMETLTVNIAGTSGSDYGTNVDVYLAEGGTNKQHREGTKVATWNPDWSTGEQSIPLDKTPEVEAGQNYTVEFVTTSNDTSGEDYLTIGADDSASETWVSVWNNGGVDSYDYYADVGISVDNSVNSLSVSADTGESLSFGDMAHGETVSKRIDLSTASSSLSWSGSGGGSIDYTLKMQERMETQDAAVYLNGEQITLHSGTLAPGETTSFSASRTLLTEGTNTVEVRVGSESVPADAPAPEVRFELRHDARDDQTVQYDGEAWSERYNVSRTWGDANQNASLTVPFSGNVVTNRDLKVFINGTEVEPTYSVFDGTELEVGLGGLDPQTKTRVVANGSKVVVRNGSIQVLGPTTEGNDLDTRFRVTSADDGFSIDVSGTASGDRVHYLANTTWTPASDYVRVENSGADQSLHVPNASAGSTATARTLPLAVDPQNDVELAVVDSTEPKFKLRPGRVTGDSVRLTYYDTDSGTEYQLLDEDNDKIAASDTAASPVHFSVDSDEETIYSIGVADSGGASGGGGGGGGRDRGSVTDIGNEPLASPIVMIVVAAAVILVGAWVASRTGLSFRWVAAVGVLVALGTLETLRPGTVTHPVEDFLGGASDVAPVLWLAAGIAALLTVYGLYSRYGKPPRVVLNRGGR